MSSALDGVPLILTLALDADSQAYFDALRKRYFPPARNFLAAHVTLFHHLPGAEYAAVAAHVAAVAAAQPCLALGVTGLRFLGRGVAYTLENPALQTLHKQLQAHWQPYLTPQDQQKLSPHVTVQNKADPTAARALHAELLTGFQPFGATGTGLQLWAYRNGPWESLGVFSFATNPAT